MYARGNPIYDRWRYSAKELAEYMARTTTFRHVDASQIVARMRDNYEEVYNNYAVSNDRTRRLYDLRERRFPGEDKRSFLAEEFVGISGKLVGRHCCVCGGIQYGYPFTSMSMEFLSPHEPLFRIRATASTKNWMRVDSVCSVYCDSCTREIERISRKHDINHRDACGDDASFVLCRLVISNKNIWKSSVEPSSKQ